MSLSYLISCSGHISFTIHNYYFINMTAISGKLVFSSNLNLCNLKSNSHYTVQFKENIWQGLDGTLNPNQGGIFKGFFCSGGMGRKYTFQYQQLLNFADVTIFCRKSAFFVEISTFTQSNSMRAVLETFQFCFQFLKDKRLLLIEMKVLKVLIKVFLYNFKLLFLEL